jgi:hypothetical protein
MAKHIHGRRRKASLVPITETTAATGLPSRLGRASQRGFAEVQNQPHSWPQKLDRLLPSTLKKVLLKVGLDTCFDIGALLPSELLELDSNLNLSAVNLVRKLLPSWRLRQCLLHHWLHQIWILLLSIFQFANFNIEQTAMPVRQQCRRSYFLEVVWVIYMIMGPVGLLWSNEIQHDVNLAKYAVLMKFQGHTENQLAPTCNLMKKWVEWHNFNVGNQARFWEARTTALHTCFGVLQSRGPSVVHNTLRQKIFCWQVGARCSQAATRILLRKRHRWNFQVFFSGRWTWQLLLLVQFRNSALCP